MLFNIVIDRFSKIIQTYRGATGFTTSADAGTDMNDVLNAFVLVLCCHFFSSLLS